MSEQSPIKRKMSRNAVDKKFRKPIRVQSRIQKGVEDIFDLKRKNLIRLGKRNGRKLIDLAYSDDLQTGHNAAWLDRLVVRLKRGVLMKEKRKSSVH